MSRTSKWVAEVRVEAIAGYGQYRWTPVYAGGFKTADRLVRENRAQGFKARLVLETIIREVHRLGPQPKGHRK